MKPLMRFVICVVVLLANSAFAKLDKVDNFTLLDHTGTSHQLREYGDSKALILISIASQCEANLESFPKYQLLKTTWEREGISFLAIASSNSDELADLQSMADLYRLELPILHDKSQLVAENLGISKAGEILVVDPVRLNVIYRGGLDIESRRARPERNIAARPGTHFLANALNTVVSDGFANVERTEVAETIGCELEFPVRDAHQEDVPDYVTDIAPILKEQCVSCHRAGGIGPFALDSHMMVQGWSPMMKEVLMTRRMPPAQVDPNVRHFTNARYMDDEDLQTLVHWIDAGSPAGDFSTDPLSEVQAPSSEWELGEPDYIVDVPAFTVPATGVLDYENVTINLPFEEDKWIKSVQHIPGDRRVLHHLLSYIVPADYEERIVEGENDRYREFLEGYAPGKDEAATYPDGSGVFLPKGSAVQMSLHYTTFGKEAVDRTRLGLYFADAEPSHQYSTFALSHGGKNLEIPPGVQEHKMQATHVFEDKVLLHGLRPHMHYRGKYMRFWVVYPDGQQEQILNVPDYNFNWQPTYRMSEPLALPAGSRVMIEGAFDNSQYNPGNPDPGAIVRGGAQSWDEMFIGYFSYHLVD